jgi:UDP-2,3-diacylglucosamine pyrophosphatase LpxH
MLSEAGGTRRFRTLFLSDIHLGTRGCQAERLIEFLRNHDAEIIYLVGDIVDGWQLRSGWADPVLEDLVGRQPGVRSHSVYYCRRGHYRGRHAVDLVPGATDASPGARRGGRNAV